MRFEKWQALGNDYLVVEASQLMFPLTPPVVQILCDPHFGPGADGVLELSPPTQRGFVARLRIFNPDGSEAELSGNGAREAIMYLRRAGWTESDTFSIETIAGEIRPTITGPTTCRVDMGRAFLRSPEYPGGPDDGTGTIAGRAFQHVVIGNPQCAIEVPDADELEGLDLAEVGPPIQTDPRFPNRTNVSFWRRLGPDRIRARIFERGVGETLSSGTGACGAAIAHVLRGGDQGQTVVLDGGELLVEVDDSLHVDLTGWAEPVFRGELAPELVERLRGLG
jgi:diaminopimelate epimerase